SAPLPRRCRTRRTRGPAPPPARLPRCAARAALPSRESLCRRTRRLASAARQVPLTRFVRSALCSVSLRVVWYTLVNERPPGIPPAEGPAGDGRVDRRLAVD